MGRKKLNKYQLRCWVEPESLDKLKLIAAAMGHNYAGEGSIGPLLDAIASQDLILIPTKNILDSSR